MKERLARRNLLWLLGALVFVAIACRMFEFLDDFRQPGHWTSSGIALGSPLPSPQPVDGLQGFCGNYIDQCTGRCVFGRFVDLPAGHFRGYAGQGVILMICETISNGETQLKEGMTSAQVLDRVGLPGRRMQADQDIYVYDEGPELLAIVLKDGVVNNLQSIRKFACPIRGASCAYYEGWWWDYLKTVSGETRSFDDAWPYFRRN